MELNILFLFIYIVLPRIILFSFKFRKIYFVLNNILSKLTKEHFMEIGIGLGALVSSWKSFVILLGRCSLIFCCTVNRESWLVFWVGWSVGKKNNKIKIILSFRVGTPKNKKILIIKVMYGSEPVSLLYDSTMSSARNFCFLSIQL